MRFILVLCLFLFSCDSPSESKKEQKLQELNEQIKLLQEKGNDYRSKAFDEVMESQEDMLTDWREFSENIKQAEEMDDRAEGVDERIKALKQKRNDLLQSMGHE